MEFVPEEARKMSRKPAEGFPQKGPERGPETKGGLPRKGEIVRGEERKDFVIVGYATRTGNAVIARYEAGGVVSETIPQERLGDFPSAELPKRAVQEWAQTAISKGDPIILESIPEDLRDELVDARGARDILFRSQRRAGHPPPLKHFRGDRVAVSDELEGKAYVLIGYHSPDRVWVGRVSQQGQLESREVATSALLPGYQLFGEVPVSPLPVQQLPETPVRYTKDLPPLQEARVRERMRGAAEKERHYYRAGERIDGGVIQHVWDTEIMVVDFENDQYLRRFYEEALAEYKQLCREGGTRISLPEGGWREMSLPEYLFNKVGDGVRWRPDLTDGLITGETQQKAKQDPEVLKGIPAIGFSSEWPQLLNQISRLPPLKNQKIALGTYVRVGFGVCRQQAAIVAACMERAIEEGRAPGWKGVEIRANIDDPGGHSWATNLDEKGEEWVVDPAQKYFGKGKSGPWDYMKGYETHVFGEAGT